MKFSNSAVPGAVLRKYLRKREGDGREGMHSWAAEFEEVRHQMDSEQREGVSLWMGSR